MALLGQAILITGATDGLGNTITPLDKPLNNPNYTQYNTLQMGQKVALNVYDKVGGRFAGVFARYCADSAAQSPSCSQGCADVNGCGILLCEVRNQGTQKAMGMQVSILKDAMLETLKAYADDSIYDIELGAENEWGLGENYTAIPVQTRVRR